MKYTKQIEDQIFQDYSHNIETLFKVYPPFEKVKKGYGYKGIVLRDKINDTIQCHICGKWFARLYMHTYQAHKLNDESYKKRFGLPLSFPLNSINFSKNQSTNFLKKWQDKEWRKVQIEIAKVRGKNLWRTRNTKNHLYAKRSDAWKNMHNLCKEQVHKRYLILCDNLGRQASNYDIHKQEPGLHKAIRDHWGTFNKFKLANNYPTLSATKDTWSQEKIIASLRRYFRIKESIPIASMFRGQRIDGFPSHETVRKHFGSWNRAMASAGFL